MPSKKTATARTVAHIKAKAVKPSTWGALAGIAGGLAAVLPQYAVPLGVASVILGKVGLLMPGAPAPEVSAP